jgi:hypothetical protein
MAPVVPPGTGVTVGAGGELAAGGAPVVGIVDGGTDPQAASRRTDASARAAAGRTAGRRIGVMVAGHDPVPGNDGPSPPER